MTHLVTQESNPIIAKKLINLQRAPVSQHTLNSLKLNLYFVEVIETKVFLERTTAIKPPCLK